MCGRFSVTASPEEVARHFDLAPGAEKRADLLRRPRYNVAPGQEIGIVRRGPDAASRVLAAARWGLVPPWAEDARIGSRLINARVETARHKAAFRVAFREGRCLVPANGFYEWSRDSAPYHVTIAGSPLFGMAALASRWSAPDGGLLESAAILTMEARGALREIHSRMPVLVPRDGFGSWLEAGPRSDAELSDWLAQLPEPGFELRRVSRRVNRVEHDDAELLRPVPEGAEPAQLGLGL